MKRGPTVGVLIVAVVFIALALAGCGSESSTTTNLSPGTPYTADWSKITSSRSPFATTSGNVSEADYKSRCQHFSYHDSANDRKPHLGQDVYYKGDLMDTGVMSTYFVKPSQVPGSSLGLDAIKVGLMTPPKVDPEYTWCVVVLWPGILPSGIDPATDSVLEVWGECQGEYDINGFDKTPVIRARYVTVYRRYGYFDSP